VLVLATLGAPERRTLLRRRAQKHDAEAEPDPTPVTTGRATVIDVGEAFAGENDAAAWLAAAGEAELLADLRVLNRTLDRFRIVTADPYLPSVGRHHVLVARIGYGAGEEVAEGLWTEARELVEPAPRLRRSEVLAPQGRLAAMLGGRDRPLACEELTIRARWDLDEGRYREAALQALVALDAAIAELPHERTADELGGRIEELREQRDPVAAAAQAALAGELEQADLETIVFVIGRIEAALRARAVAASKFAWSWWGVPSP
jgi:hypothetical protein